MRKLVCALGTCILLVGTFIGVQKLLYWNDYRVAKDVGEKIISNNIEASDFTKESKLVVHIPEKKFKGVKLLTIYLDDINPDIVRISGKAKKGNKVVDYVISGTIGSTQKLTVEGEEIEGGYIEHIYRGLKLNMFGTDYTILSAECILTGK